VRLARVRAALLLELPAVQQRVSFRKALPKAILTAGKRQWVPLRWQSRL